jgi:hypothetical protein
MKHWLRNGAIGLSTAFLMLLAMPQARADEPCALGDLTCVVDSVGDTVDQAGGTANDVVGTAGDTLNQVVGTVKHVVDGNVPLDPGPGGGGGTGPGGGGGSQPGGGGGGIGSSGAHAGTSGAPGSAGVTATVQPGRGGRSSSTVSSGPSTGEVAVELDRRTQPRTTLAQVAAEVAVGALALFVLGGLMLGFLVVQDRLDRKDPRLAPASFGSDRVSFG